MKPIRLTRQALGLTLAATLATSPAAFAQSVGFFSFANLGTGNSDALVGLSASKTYLQAYNLNDTANLTINGVLFTGVNGANPAVGGVFNTSGLGTVFNGGGTNPGGVFGSLTNRFIYGAGSTPEVFNFTNLTPGQTYVVTFYNRSWEAAGGRRQTLSATNASTGLFFGYDQDNGATGQGSLNVLRYTFLAESATQSISFLPLANGVTAHQYGFSVENYLGNSNTWTSGSDWTTAAWSVGVPNAIGANAMLPAQGTPTTLTLDANVTVNHLQFDGTNAWTLANGAGNTLTLQGDVGGTNVINATAGSHSIAPHLVLATSLGKMGAGTVTVGGNVSGPGSVTSGGGTLTLNGANSHAGHTIVGGGVLNVNGPSSYAGSTVVNAGTMNIAANANTTNGSLILNGGVLNLGSFSDYGVASSMGLRLATSDTNADNNLATSGIGLHFRGGTLQYTGSTPQSTNRNMRVSLAGATLDASGSVPSATLSLTRNGPNTNFFETPGARTVTLTGTNTGDNGFSILLENQGGSGTHLTKTGTGNWVLNGTIGNSSTGATTVTNGSLVLGKTGVVAVNGTLVVGNGSDQAVVLLGGTGGNQINNATIPSFGGSGPTAGILRVNNLAETIGGLNSAAGLGIVENESGSAGTGTLSLNVTGAPSFGGLLRDGDASGSDGLLAIAKLGAGTQTFTGTATHTGGTTLSAGTFTNNGTFEAGSNISVGGTATLNGAGTFHGTVNVNLGGTLSGSGVYNGVVTAGNGGVVSGSGPFANLVTQSGSRLSPGGSASIGTINAASLSLASGAVLDLELGGTSDLVNVTGPGGLALNGGVLNLYNAGGVTPLSVNGTYDLLSYNTSFTGNLFNLSIGNSQVGKLYVLNDTGFGIELTMSDATVSNWNGAAADGLWTSAGNWSAGVPNSAGSVATFGPIPGSPTAVNLNGGKTVGSLTFHNANAYTLSGGTLAVDNGFAFGAFSLTLGNHVIDSPVSLAGSGLFVTTASGTTLTFGGDVSGGKPLGLGGAGTVILTGANSHSTTSVDGATLRMDGTLGTGDVSLANGASVVFNRADSVTVSNNLVGTEGLISQNGAGILTLSGTNTVGSSGAGSVSLNAGTVRLGSAGALPSGVAVNFNGGDLDLNSFNLNASSLSGSSGVITDHSAVAGTTGVTLTTAADTSLVVPILNGGTRALALTKNGNATLTLTAANTFTGGTTITGGTVVLNTVGANALTGPITIGDAANSDVLLLGASDQIDDASVLTFTAGGSGNSAFFRLAGFNETVRGIQTTTAQAAVIENGTAGAGTLTVDTGSDNYTYDGIIRNQGGTLALTKSGTGTLTLANTAIVVVTNYTGATTINEGVLHLSNLNFFASPIINNGTAASLVIDQSTRTLAYGAVLSGNGLTKQGIGTLSLNNGANTLTGGILVNEGTLQLSAIPGGDGPGQFSVVGPNDPATTVTVNNGGTLAINATAPLGNSSLTSAFSPSVIVNAGGKLTGNNFVAFIPNLTLNGGTVEIGHGNTTDGFDTNLGLLGTVVVSGTSPSLITTTGSGATAVASLGAMAATAGTTFQVADVTGNSAADLTISSILIDTQNTGEGVTPSPLDKTGPGTLLLSGANTYSGGTNVMEGTLALGSATALGSAAVTVVGGSLDLNGQTAANTATIDTAGTLTGSGSLGATAMAGNLAPGGSGSGLITLASATVSSTASFAFQLGAFGSATRGTDYDALTVNSGLVLDGTVTVTLNGLTPAGGQSFNLIDCTGAIDDTDFNVATDLILPTLGGGLSWNTSAFISSGVISISGGDPVASYATSFGLSGPDTAADADPDGDGIENIFEYAFGTSPIANNGPEYRGVASTASGQLVLSYRRPVGGVGGVTYGVEFKTTDLNVGNTGWIPGVLNSNYTQIITPNGDGTETVAITLTTPFTDKKFGRITVVTP